MVDEDLEDVLKNLDKVKQANVISLKNDGNTYYKQGFYEEALESYNQALQIDPDNTDLLNNKGLTLVKLGKIDEAKEIDKKRTEILKKSLQQQDVALPLPSPVLPSTIDSVTPVLNAPSSGTSEKINDKDKGVQKPKDPVLAAILSLLWPGLGQAYNGQYWKGLLLIIIQLGGILLLLIPTIIGWIYGIFDAYYSSKKMNRGEIPPYKTNAGHMVLFALIPIALIMMGSIMAAIYINNQGSGSSFGSRSGYYPTPYPTTYSYSYYNTPAPVQTPTLSKAALDQLKNAALMPTYTNLFKNINAYTGKVVYFRGKVLQLISRGNNQYDLRIGTQEPYYGDNIIYVHYLGNPLVIENEIVDVWGKVDGVTDYYSVSGATISIPEITAIDITPYSTETGGSQYAQLPQTYANPSDLSMTVSKNPTYGFSIQYPKAWDKTESYNRNTGYYLTTLSIKDENDDNLATFVVYASPSDIQPEEAYLSIFNSISGIPGVVVQPGSAVTQLDNHRAYRFDYYIKNRNDYIDRKGFAISTVIKKKSYILAFEAKKDYYENNYAVIQSMIDSFDVP
jgi:tetratricopeptide (TPR) repeat protein